jgi:hypothetical protein
VERKERDRENWGKNQHKKVKVTGAVQVLEERRAAVTAMDAYLHCKQPNS